MAEEFIPCWRIDRFSPGRKSFAFIDTAEYHADQLFINEGIQIKFKEEFIHSESKYRLIFCNCLKRDVNKFIKAISKLSTKMLIIGNTDYIDYCKDFEKKMGERFAESRVKHL